MFGDVPECSGMFHIPGFIDGFARKDLCFGICWQVICEMFINRAAVGWVVLNLAVVYFSF